MSVVLSVEALSPVLTGIGRYAWELASRLPDRMRNEEVRFYRNGRWVQNPATLLEQDPASGTTKFPKWIRWVKRVFEQDRANKLPHECRGLVFHGPNYFLPPCADLGVATVHDLSIFKYPEMHPAERIKHFERDFLISMSRAKHLITDSESTRLEVIDYLGWAPEKITSVPLGVSSLFMPADGFMDDGLSVCLRRYGLTVGHYTLCVSTLEPRKKIGNLLEAYQCLPEILRNRYPLVLVGGGGWLSESLVQDIARFVAQGWLKYLGFVPMADLPAIYAGARTFAYPSVYEGFGLPVLEAMASGVPVVTSDSSSLPEVTKGAALLGNPNDVPALAVHLEKSLLDEPWRQMAVAKGLDVADHLTWDRCVDATVAVYQKVRWI